MIIFFVFFFVQHQTKCGLRRNDQHYMVCCKLKNIAPQIAAYAIVAYIQYAAPIKIF